MSDTEALFQAVLTAMQPAEEMGGPNRYDYVALMLRIAVEAKRRADVAAHFAKSEITVIMRPPTKGERGWWVEARTPNSALAEVIREMDDGGWIADRDYDGKPDEYNMIAVTVVMPEDRS